MEQVIRLTGEPNPYIGDVLATGLKGRLMRLLCLQLPTIGFDSILL